MNIAFHCCLGSACSIFYTSNKKSCHCKKGCLRLRFYREMDGNKRIMPQLFLTVYELLSESYKKGLSRHQALVSVRPKPRESTIADFVENHILHLKDLFTVLMPQQASGLPLDAHEQTCQSLLATSGFSKTNLSFSTAAMPRSC